MHELSLCAGILDILEDQAAAQDFKRILTVKLAIGALAAVEVEALRGCFEIVSRGTVAEGASLHIDRVPAAGRCNACAGTFEVVDYVAACPACPDQLLTVSGGQDLGVTQLEVD